MAIETTIHTFEIGDLIAYPWDRELIRPYKVIRVHRRATRRGGIDRSYFLYDLIDDALGLPIYRTSLKGCRKVGEDCARKLTS